MGLARVTDLVAARRSDTEICQLFAEDLGHPSNRGQKESVAVKVYGLRNPHGNSAQFAGMAPASTSASLGHPHVRFASLERKWHPLPIQVRPGFGECSG